MLRRIIFFFSLPLACVGSLPVAAVAATADVPPVTVDWAKTTFVSRSTPTLQVVVNPPLRRGSSIHDPVYAALHDLGAENVRYVPWLPYPRLAVAELKPPTATNTSWDFSLIDPMTIDFLEATKGHPTILNFSTIPAWLFKTEHPVTYPDDPNAPYWNYTQGTELKDPTLKDLGDYYARLVSWYGQGGFTDELGVRHNSGYHYDIAWWEVLNEVEAEHQTTPQQYTERYDAIVSAIHQVSPKTKFVGLALAYANRFEYYEYFLDPKHHRPGIPLDMISYHFYADPGQGTNAANPAAWHFCEQADKFLDTVRKVEVIRQRLSPATKTDTDELGVIAPDQSWQNQPFYWNAAGAMYAYLYLELSKLGIENVGESQLVGYPTQYPSVSMVNWETGQPNARFRVLELLKHNFGPGDSLVATGVASSGVAVQAYRTAAGRKLLLINKEDATVGVDLPPGTMVSRMEAVDAAAGGNPAESSTISGTSVTLTPFAVAVISLKTP
jgi:Glycosyl hydrolases family 39